MAVAEAGCAQPSGTRSAHGCGRGAGGRAAPGWGAAGHRRRRAAVVHRRASAPTHRPQTRPTTGGDGLPSPHPQAPELTSGYLGTERILNSGRGPGRHPRRRLGGGAQEPADAAPWLLAALEQAGHCAAPGTRPVVVLTAGQGTGRPLQRLVVLDFADWWGGKASSTADAAIGARFAEPVTEPAGATLPLPLRPPLLVGCDGLMWEEVGLCGGGQGPAGGEAGTEGKHGRRPTLRPALTGAFHALLHDMLGTGLHRPRANRQPLRAPVRIIHPLPIGGEGAPLHPHHLGRGHGRRPEGEQRRMHRSASVVVQLGDARLRHAAASGVPSP